MPALKPWQVVAAGCTLGIVGVVIFTTLLSQTIALQQPAPMRKPNNAPQRIRTLESKLDAITRRVEPAPAALPDPTPPPPPLPVPLFAPPALPAIPAVVRKGSSWLAEQPLVVMTYASNNVFKFCRMLESSAQQRVHLRVLGWDPNKETRKTGLGHKILAAAAALEDYDDTVPVLFVDAFDVLFAQPAAKMLTEFQSLKHDLIFSAEKGCWPYLDGRPHGPRMCLRYYPDTRTPYRFVNTGSWIGYTRAVRYLLSAIVHGKEARTVGNANDQELVTDFFVCDYINSLIGLALNTTALLERIGWADTIEQAFSYLPGCEMTGRVKYGIALDYECAIFQSMHNSEVDQSIHAVQALDVHVSYNAERRAWQNKHTLTFPAIFHGNGGGKQHIEPVFAKIMEAVDPARAAAAAAAAAGSDPNPAAAFGGAAAGAGPTVTRTLSVPAAAGTAPPAPRPPRNPTGPLSVDEYDYFLHFDNHPEFRFQETCVDRPPDK